MEPVYLVQNDEYVAIACKAPTGAVYLIAEDKPMTSFTAKKQREFKVIEWDKTKATEIAKNYNDRYSALKIDLSKL